MTFENALKRIADKFEAVDGSKLADMAVQVTLTDEDCGGIMYFKVADGVIDVQGYDYRDNDAAIEIERKTLMDILSGKTTLDKAIEKGRATVMGSFDKLNTLNDAIPAYAPAKKTAKKAAEKTEAKAEVKEAKPAEKTTAKKACGTKRGCAAKKTGTAKKTTTTKKTAANKS